MKLSREKRREVALYQSVYFYDRNTRFNTDIHPDEFFHTTKFRSYFEDDNRIDGIIPINKIEQSIFFKDKYYYPKTYIKNPKLEGIWFIKPTDGSWGSGIEITDDLSSVKNNKKAIYQQSIVNPLLHKNKKIDFRTFLLLQTFEGKFRAYFYKDSMLRWTTLDYKKDDFTLERQITNYLAERDGKFFGNTMVRAYSKQTYHYYKELHETMKNVIVDISKSIFDRVNNKTQRNIFQLFGVDFIPDEDKNVWLLEMNGNPGPYLHLDRPLTKQLKNWTLDIVEDIFDLTVYPMYYGRKKKLGEFELVFEKDLQFEKWIEV